MDDFEGYTLSQLADAISMIESNGGKNIAPRDEPNFEKTYLRDKDGTPKEPWNSLAQKYGWKAIRSSYGKYQVMYPTAHDFGYRGTPQGLADPEVNRK